MNSKKLFFLSITLLLITNSCIYNVDEFTEEELKWTKPFNKNQTIIFRSEKGEFDTIIFKKAVVSNETVNDLERGFYKSNYLDVPYKFSKGSYHQFERAEQNFEQSLIGIERSSAGFGGIEIVFIGLLFDEDGIKKAQTVDNKTYYFDSKNATALWVYVKDGIKNFTFNTEIGIINYTDERNIKWIRK